MTEDQDRWLDQSTRIWSFFEATLWYVIPDAWLLGVCMAHPDSAARLAKICFRWSAAGVGLCWLLCSLQPDGMRHLMFGLPFTLPVMAEWVRGASEDYGVWSALYQPFSNIPVKVWTLAGSANLGWSLFHFLPLVAASRALRMVLAAHLGAWVGRRLPQWIRRRPNLGLATYSLFIVYLLWWTSRSISV